MTKIVNDNLVRLSTFENRVLNALTAERATIFKA